MKRRLQNCLALLSLIALVTMALLPATCGEPESVAMPSEERSDDDSVTRTGEQIFAMTCASCHGSEGEGADNWTVRDADGRLPPPPLNGDGHTWHHSDGVLYGIVSDGGLGLGFGSNMPAFKDQLTREQIIAVLEYVKSLWEGKQRDGIALLQYQQDSSAADPYPADE
ncbi:MAG: c-type cytochrome [Chloroflexi bacterium]|nr:c-type cytochrome [Chloroflexota bacterium]MCY3695556.1 c-type cytochrome [Chloroflexota bacterium]